MKDLYKEHIDITNEVKESIQKLKVVFPAEYNRIYSEKAKSHHIELNPDQVISSEMLDEKMVRHLITLSQCTDDAIHDIETEDKHLLSAVLAEPKALQ